MSLKELLSRKLFEICEKENCTLNGLSYKIGINQSTLENITSGRVYPKIITLARILSKLNISLKEFFSDERFSGNFPDVDQYDE